MQTPLLSLTHKAKQIFAKLEGHNLSGSVKDRFAKFALEKAEREGQLRKGMTIIESSAGNSALALQEYAQNYYNLEFVLPESTDQQTRTRLQAQGTTLHFTTDPFASLDLIEQRCQDPAVHWTRQYFRDDSQEMYAALAAEMPSGLDAIVTCVGTGGVFTGMAQLGIPTIAVMAATESTIPGLRPHEASFDHPSYQDVFDPAKAASVEAVTGGQALQGLARLAEKKVAGGLSSGAAIYIAMHCPYEKVGVILADGKLLDP